MSRKYSRPVMKGVVMLAGTLGPMATDMTAVVDVCRHLWTEESTQYILDPYTAPLPFREKIFEDDRPLKVGFYMDDGFFEVRNIHVE